MAAQKGSALLMKIGDGASPEVFTTIGGMRSTALAMNDEAVDVTNKDSGRARTLLAQGGVNSMTVTGSGVFTDSASETTLRSKFDSSSFNAINSLFQILEHLQGRSCCSLWNMLASSMVRLHIALHLKALAQSRFECGLGKRNS